MTNGLYTDNQGTVFDDDGDVFIDTGEAWEATGENIEQYPAYIEALQSGEVELASFEVGDDVADEPATPPTVDQAYEQGIMAEYGRQAASEHIEQTQFDAAAEDARRTAAEIAAVNEYLRNEALSKLVAEKGIDPKNVSDSDKRELVQSADLIARAWQGETNEQGEADLAAAEAQVKGNSRFLRHFIGRPDSGLSDAQVRDLAADKLPPDAELQQAKRRFDHGFLDKPKDSMDAAVMDLASDAQDAHKAESQATPAPAEPEPMHWDYDLKQYVGGDADHDQFDDIADALRGGSTNS